MQHSPCPKSPVLPVAWRRANCKSEKHSESGDDLACSPGGGEILRQVKGHGPQVAFGTLFPKTMEQVVSQNAELEFSSQTNSQLAATVEDIVVRFLSTNLHITHEVSVEKDHLQIIFGVQYTFLWASKLQYVHMSKLEGNTSLFYQLLFNLITTLPNKPSLHPGSSGDHVVSLQRRPIMVFNAGGPMMRLSKVT